MGGVGGLRGYFQEELPVGAGLVGSLEARVELPGPEIVDVGLTAFFDGGEGQRFNGFFNRLRSP